MTRRRAAWPGRRHVRLMITGLAAAAVAASAVTAAGLDGAQPRAVAPHASSAAVPATGTLARFAILAGQHSNQCSLQPAMLMSFPPAQRLQGSCCTAMDPARYQAQVAWLRRYAAIRQIPADPYDIPAGLARQLIGYQAAIRLSPAQQDTYLAAMRQAPEKGPCCCGCWRWTAFQGLSSYLIARRHWPAPQLAALIGNLDGCGGAA